MAQNIDIELVIKAGQSAQTLGEIKQSVKDVTEALKNVKTGTEEFERLKEVFQQNRANVKAMRQEFSELKQVEGVGKILTSSFAAATASISLFTGESEKAEKAVRKVEAAFVLMESVQKLARAFREAAIANETFNKSLLTNPYVLVATAILAIGYAIYSYVNDTEAAEEATKKLAESAQKLNDVKVDALKDQVDRINEVNEEAIKTAEQELELIKIRKGSVDEEYKAKVKVNELTSANAKEQLKSFGDSEIQEINAFNRRKDIYKAQSEFLQDQKTKLEAIHSRTSKAADDEATQLELNIKNTEKGLAMLKEQNASTKERAELYKQILDTIDKTERAETNDEAEVAEKKREQAVVATHNAILERIKSEKKGNDEYQTSLEGDIELLKAMGGTEKEQSNLRLAVLGEEISKDSKLAETQKKRVDATKSAMDSIKDKSTEQFKAAQDNYKAEKDAYDDTLKNQETLNQKKRVEVEINKQLAKGETEDKAAKAIALLDKAYDEQASKLKNLTDVMKAKGAEDNDVSKASISNNMLLINSLDNEIAAVNDSGLADDAKGKKIDELKKKIQDLVNENNVLIGSMAKAGKSPFFSDKQLKDVQGYVKLVKEAAQVVEKVGNAITQSVEQNVQRRIALYQHENDVYTSGLQNALDEGFLSQQEFNKKKAAADAELKKQKQAEEHKAFVAHKATSIVMAGISTALAVVNALATAPTFIAGIVFAALAGAAGAVEIGTIAAAKEPASYAVGGLVEGIGNGTSDSITARVSNGESIMNAKSTAAFKPLLSAINQMGGGVALKGTPVIQKAPSGTISTSAPSQASPAPQRVYVTESDISRIQRKVAVIQSRSTF